MEFTAVATGSLPPCGWLSASTDPRRLRPLNCRSRRRRVRIPISTANASIDAAFAAPPRRIAFSPVAAGRVRHGARASQSFLPPPGHAGPLWLEKRLAAQNEAAQPRHRRQPRPGPCPRCNPVQVPLALVAFTRPERERRATAESATPARRSGRAESGSNRGPGGRCARTTRRAASAIPTWWRRRPTPPSRG